MGEYTTQTQCAVHIDQPIFEPFPAQVVFQDHKPQQEYTAVLSLRNNDRVTRRIKVAPPASPHFAITPRQRGNKVAAGMDASYTVTFTPDSEESFHWDLVVCTEREKFIVPLRARGARGVLSLPTIVDFGLACPCKVVSKKAFLVRNIGRREAAFSLHASTPFAAAPAHANLGVGETLQLSVTFKPEHAAAASANLTVVYDCGETATVTLAGSGVDMDVRAVPDTVTFMDTFVTKMTQRTFTLVNNGTQPAAFALKRYATSEEDEAVMRAEATTLLLQAEASDSAGSFASADASALLGRASQVGMLPAIDEARGPQADEAEAALQRRQRRALTEARARKHLFESNAIKAFPLEGVIYPASAIEVLTANLHMMLCAV